MKKTRADQALKTKSKIIATAMEIFSIEGVNGLTSGKLAKKLNMSKGTVFHHFESMEELHVAVLDVIIATMTNEIDAVEFVSVQEFVDVIVDIIFRDTARYSGVYAALFSFVGSAKYNELYRLKLKGMFDANMERWVVLLTQKLKKDVPAEKLADIVRLLDMHMAGLLVHNIIFMEQKRYRKLTSQFLFQMISSLE
jgi:AcrR family transcriptional regulator